MALTVNAESFLLLMVERRGYFQPLLAIGGQAILNQCQHAGAEGITCPLLEQTTLRCKFANSLAQTITRSDPLSYDSAYLGGLEELFTAKEDDSGQEIPLERTVACPVPYENIAKEPFVYAGKLRPVISIPPHDSNTKQPSLGL
jgi:hypothetical protein